MLERVGGPRGVRGDPEPCLTAARDPVQLELNLLVGQAAQPLLGFTQRLGLGEGLVQPWPLAQPVLIKAGHQERRRAIVDLPER